MSTSPTVQISTAGSYVITSKYSDYIINCSNGSISLTLPTITSSGIVINITRSDATVTSNTLSISPAPGQKINRQGPTTIFQINQSEFRYVSYVTTTDIGWFYGPNSVGTQGPQGIQGNSGTIALAPIGATSNINGMSLNGNVLNLQPASAAFGGVVTTGNQAFSGPKQFVDTTQATSNTAAAVTFAGGIGVTKQIVIGAVGNIGDAGLKLNSALLGYNPGLLTVNEDYTNTFNCIAPLTGSTTIYISRIGRAVTMTINEFTGTANNTAPNVFNNIPTRFMASADTNFSVWVIFGVTNTYSTLRLLANGTLQIFGTNFATNNIPAGTFTLKQCTLSYNVV